MTDEQRSDDDPRKRPPDPAGTRPRHAPADLLPSHRGRLWSEPGAPGASPAADGPPPVASSSAAGGTTARSGSGLFTDPERVAAPEDEAPAAVAAPRAAADDGHGPFANRFQFITGGLLAFAVAGVIVLLLVALGGEDKAERGPTVAWSSWAPVDNGQDGPTQIAAHVGPKYRLQGRQLVNVEGGPMAYADVPLTVVRRTIDGDLDTEQGTGVLYRLCGLGENCSIPAGEPSPERLLLLRREALELALYSFRYLDVDHVVAFLPPAPDQTEGLVVRIRRADVTDALVRPLTATLAERTPSVETVEDSPDTPYVERVTGPALFSGELTQVNGDLRAYLVLESPQATSARPKAATPSSGAATGSGSGSSSSSGSTGGGPNLATAPKTKAP